MRHALPTLALLVAPLTGDAQPAGNRVGPLLPSVEGRNLASNTAGPRATTSGSRSLATGLVRPKVAVTAGAGG